MRPISCTIRVRSLSSARILTIHLIDLPAAIGQLLHAHLFFDSKPLASSRARASSLPGSSGLAAFSSITRTNALPTTTPSASRLRTALDPPLRFRSPRPAEAGHSPHGGHQRRDAVRDAGSLAGHAGSRNQVHESAGIFRDQLHTPADCWWARPGTQYPARLRA